MTQLFQVFLYKPILNLLVLAYNFFGHDLGVAIIIITFILKVFLLPLSQKAIKSQMELQKLQPKQREIQKKYKADKERQAKELMKLFQTHKVSPLSGCLPILIQLPVLIALYRVFRYGVVRLQSSDLYNFVVNPGMMNNSFLGMLDLSKPSFPLAVAVGILQYFQSKLALKRTPSLGPGGASAKNKGALGQMMGSQMVYMMPLFTVIISLGLPAALPLYWAALTLFAIGEELFFQRKFVHKEKAKS